ncbi:MAG: hypothetical protein WAP03_06165 [Methylorubrum rhodinum]|uniref:hypothetical protein n=1 Tax=Methylorubrum rhodinum TaxID=29428 RepID=UPI003BAF9E31
MLSEKQSCKFVEAIEHIYAAASAPALWPTALERVAAFFSDRGALLLYQRDDASLGTIINPEFEPVQRDYEQTWWRHDIRFARSLTRAYIGGSDAITDRHVVTSVEIDEHPFYAQFLVSHGLRWFAGVTISPNPSVPAVLSVQRSREKVNRSGFVGGCFV